MSVLNASVVVFLDVLQQLISRLEVLATDAFSLQEQHTQAAASKDVHLNLLLDAAASWSAAIETAVQEVDVFTIQIDQAVQHVIHQQSGSTSPLSQQDRSLLQQLIDKGADAAARLQELEQAAHKIKHFQDALTSVAPDQDQDQDAVNQPVVAEHASTDRQLDEKQQTSRPAPQSQTHMHGQNKQQYGQGQHLAGVYPQHADAVSSALRADQARTNQQQRKLAAQVLQQEQQQVSAHGGDRAIAAAAAHIKQEAALPAAARAQQPQHRAGAVSSLQQADQSAHRPALSQQQGQQLLPLLLPPQEFRRQEHQLQKVAPAAAATVCHIKQEGASHASTGAAQSAQGLQAGQSAPHQQQQPEAPAQPQLTDLPGQHGPEACRLVHIGLQAGKLPGIPNQQQMVYFDLADKPFSAAELRTLHKDKLVPYVAERVTASVNRSGCYREQLVQVAVKKCRVEMHYPQLAPAILRLRDTVPGLVQQQHKTKGSMAVKQSALKDSQAAKQLLLVLRCLGEWDKQRSAVHQQQVPLLLQLLLAVEADAVKDVVEVVDLISDEENEQAEQQMLASGADVLLTKDITKDVAGMGLDGVHGPAAAGVAGCAGHSSSAVKVKAEPRPQ